MTVGTLVQSQLTSPQTIDLRGMARKDPASIHILSNELLREVLDHIEADPDKLVSLDRRAYLSQESFKPPSFPSRDQAQDLGNFRLTCRRFSELGSIHQFARVTTRFSEHGLERLEQIAAQPHLARHVRKFSYMMPYFYDDSVSDRELSVELRRRLPEVDPRHFIKKIDEQKRIRTKEKDFQILRKALSTFTSLAHIQILRVQDYEDNLLIRYLRHSPDRLRVLEPMWAPACFHSTKTIGAALLGSQSPCSRFSSPMLSTGSADRLAAHPPDTLSVLVGRLTSLELHFDDSIGLDDKMSGLSDLFRRVLSAAVNMQSIHVGFPSHFPLSLPLEDLFHGIRWENLIAFGIQAWKLEAREIIGLVRRHRDKLRGLRLRDVLLKADSRWRDVLKVLREDLKRLEWVSLRRIGYAGRFEEQMAGVGIEIEDVPGGDSESGDEEDEVSITLSEVDGHSNHVSDADMEDDSEEDDDPDENGPHANEMSFPQLSDDPRRWCDCNGHQAPSVDELGDDSDTVSNAQRKLWEKWCTRRCFHEDLRRPY